MDSPIRLLKTAFVSYYHADLAKARQFYLDFGLQIVLERHGEIFFKGYGPEPFCYRAREAPEGEPSRFDGAAYVVESRAELLRAATSVPNVSPLVNVDDSFPGGGELVTLQDPEDFKVILIHGQKQLPEEAMDLQKLEVNYENDKPRLGRFQRLKPGPAPVYRWGHYGVTYTPGNFEKMFDWYTKVIGLAPSDFLHRDEKPVTCFLHIDQGKGYTDHHSFFFKPAKPGQTPSVAHAAFEVHDFDVQQLGHYFLESKGYKLCWGVGRHILGSQVFDYWFDTSGFMVEHYADGDLVNKDTPIGNVQAGPQSLSVWGPPLPSVF